MVNTFKLDDLVLTEDKSKIQIVSLHELLSKQYWCKGLPIETLKMAIEGSLCFSGFHSDKQIAFARVVTDQATFAWICDVVVDDRYRRKGVAMSLMKYILQHPKLQGLRRICLATKDAHRLYESFGFQVTQTPQNWMEIKNNEIYLKLK